jgi:hypothetical protein
MSQSIFSLYLQSIGSTTIKSLIEIPIGQKSKAFWTTDRDTTEEEHLKLLYNADDVMAVDLAHKQSQT